MIQRWSRVVNFQNKLYFVAYDKNDIWFLSGYISAQVFLKKNVSNLLKIYFYTFFCKYFLPIRRYQFN
jgi:hypothetical protein